jgi:dTDP-4-dehydrorhamnose reductase
MAKILITGANGLVGQALTGRFNALPMHSLLATSLSKQRLDTLNTGSFARLDITSGDQVKETFAAFNPDVVIHCAAVTDVDPCELDPEKCELVNIEGTRNVVREAAALGAKIVYLSTDFVFDGLHGPYGEDDEPNPVSTYGWSKLQGEYIVRSSRVPWAIVRTILVYGVTPSMKRNNLVTWVYRSLSANQTIRVVDDQFRMPTLVDDLADGIIRIVEREKTGIWHLSGPEMVSVYDFAITTARFFGLDETLISPIKSEELNQAGRRPPSTGFLPGKASEELGYSPHNLDSGLGVVRNLLEDVSI